jgi:hypothetical protein
MRTTPEEYHVAEECVARELKHATGWEPLLGVVAKNNNCVRTSLN